jgi:hypothetical protein
LDLHFNNNLIFLLPLLNLRLILVGNQDLEVTSTAFEFVDNFLVLGFLAW